MLHEVMRMTASAINTVISNGDGYRYRISCRSVIYRVDAGVIIGPTQEQWIATFGRGFTNHDMCISMNGDENAVISPWGGSAMFTQLQRSSENNDMYAWALGWETGTNQIKAMPSVSTNCRLNMLWIAGDPE